MCKEVTESYESVSKTSNAHLHMTNYRTQKYPNRRARPFVSDCYLLSQNEVNNLIFFCVLVGAHIIWLVESEIMVTLFMYFALTRRVKLRYFYVLNPMKAYQL
jgi:hypothetical protein